MFLKRRLVSFLTRLIKLISALVDERNARRRKYPRFVNTVTLHDVRSALLLLDYPLPNILKSNINTLKTQRKRNKLKSEELISSSDE